MVIFKKEIYATSAIVASVSCMVFSYLQIDYLLNVALSLSICTFVRYASVRFNLHLPKAF